MISQAKGPPLAAGARSKLDLSKMFAVIKAGGKQYKVAPSDLIEVATVPGEAGDVVTFDEVLLHGDENSTILGGPLVAGAAVAGEIVGQKRTARILVFKKRRRQNSKRSRGHRQDFTLVRITEILTDGKKASPRKEKVAAPKAAKAAADGDEPEAKAAKPARKSRAKKSEE
jgi:large subunit ribosomal protein L21